MQSRSPRVHAATLLDTLLLTRNGPKVLPEGGPPGTHVVYGNRSFDYHHADFVLFGVTAEEIRWLQSGVVVQHVTVRPLRRHRHLRQRARRERRSRTRLSSVRPSSCAPSRTPAVSGLLRKKGRGSLAVRGATCVTPGQLGVDPPRPPCAPASTASFSLKIERRFMRRVAHKVGPRVSGCPIHKKQLLLVFVVWAPPRKKRNQEQHALNSSSRNVRQRVDLANDDDLEPTLVLSATAPGAAADRPRSSLGTSLSREAGSLRAPSSGRRSTPWRWASSRPPKRTDGTSWRWFPIGTTGPLSCSSHFDNLRPSDYMPVEEVNILRALEGGLHIRAHNGLLFTPRGLLADLRRGFLVVRSAARRR